MLAGGPGRGVSLPPPVEPLLVARRTPLSQVKKAAEQHMAGIYAMLENWQAGHSFLHSESCERLHHSLVYMLFSPFA